MGTLRYRMKTPKFNTLDTNNAQPQYRIHKILENILGLNLHSRFFTLSVKADRTYVVDSRSVQLFQLRACRVRCVHVRMQLGHAFTEQKAQHGVRSDRYVPTSAQHGVHQNRQERRLQESLEC